MRASQSRPQIGEERPAGAHLHAARRPDLAGGARRFWRPSRASCWWASAAVSPISSSARPRPGPRLGPWPERAPPASELQVSRPPPGVEFFNGLGGFAEDGREYVTILGPGQSTPAPWINVIANPGFRLPGVGGGRRLRLVA